MPLSHSQHPSGARVPHTVHHGPRDSKDRRAELLHVRNALRANKYKEWALEAFSVLIKQQVTSTDKTTIKSTRLMLVLPYIQGLSVHCHGPSSHITRSMPVPQAQQYHPLMLVHQLGQNPQREIVRHHSPQHV